MKACIDSEQQREQQREQQDGDTTVMEEQKLRSKPTSQSAPRKGLNLPDVHFRGINSEGLHAAGAHVLTYQAPLTWLLPTSFFAGTVFSEDLGQWEE